MQAFDLLCWSIFHDHENNRNKPVADVLEEFRQLEILSVIVWIRRGACCFLTQVNVLCHFRDEDSHQLPRLWAPHCLHQTDSALWWPCSGCQPLCVSCANIPGGKVPGLCPIPQVFEKEDEPYRNRTWIRLLRHETGRPLHVQVRRSGLHRRRRSRILSAVRNSCWLFTLAHALFAYRSKWKSRKVHHYNDAEIINCTSM